MVKQGGKRKQSGGKTTANRGRARNESRPSGQDRTGAGARTGARTGTRTGTRAKAEKEYRPQSKPGAGEGTGARRGSGTKAGARAGTRAASEAKSKTGSRSQTRPERGSRGTGAGAKGRAEKDGLVRLNKYIAAAGICSRREADELIGAGLVTVNGKPVTTLGTKVGHGDDVRYNGESLQNERKVYLLLNKPKDYVTTTDDPKERKTVMMLVKNACKERIYPVGRLDRNTTGVLLFTNDGDLAKKLTHPGHKKKKIYHVFLDRAFSAGDMRKLAGGLTLDDGFIQPDAVSYASKDSKKEVGLEIHSGQNRIVRRMFEALGYRVRKLDRVYFAGLTKKNLTRGQWRFLTTQEINRLKMNAYE